MFAKKLLASTVLMLSAGSVAAMPSDLADLKTDSGDKLLTDVPEGQYFDTGAGYVSLTDTSNNQDDANATLLAERAELENGNSFGIFDKTSGNSLTLFKGGTDPTTGVTVAFDLGAGTATNQTSGESAMIGETFGFFLDNGDGNTFFSDPSMNTELDHSLLFDTTGTSGEGLFGSDIVVAFEDRTIGDRDYNDLVVGMTDVAASVPEPDAIALMGMGLLGLGALRRKRSSDPATA